MKENKISIIVPVYNISNYVKECIESILKQDFKDYELILIDDGSIDNSGQICDLYCTDQRVKCFHKKNGGLSSARNYGIDKATGEYLMFVDGDDYLKDEKCLTDIYNEILKTKSDIIQYKMIYYYQADGKIKNLPDLDIKYLENYKRFFENMVKNGTLSISACDKVVKSSLIKDNKLLFDETLLSEDIDWSLHLYLIAKSITPINREIYVYRQQRQGSITNTKSKKTTDSLIRIIDKWYNHCYEDSDMQKIYYNYLAYQYLILISTIKKEDITKEEKIFLKKTSELLKYSNNRKVKLAIKLKKTFGLNIMIFGLKIYNSLRRKGIIKL